MGWWTIQRNNVHRHIITHINNNIQYNEYDTSGGLSHSVSWFHEVVTLHHLKGEELYTATYLTPILY